MALSSQQRAFNLFCFWNNLFNFLASRYHTSQTLNRESRSRPRGKTSLVYFMHYKTAEMMVEESLWLCFLSNLDAGKPNTWHCRQLLGTCCCYSSGEERSQLRWLTQQQHRAVGSVSACRGSSSVGCAEVQFWPWVISVMKRVLIGLSYHIRRFASLRQLTDPYL